MKDVSQDNLPLLSYLDENKQAIINGVNHFEFLGLFNTFFYNNQQKKFVFVLPTRDDVEFASRLLGARFRVISFPSVFEDFYSSIVPDPQQMDKQAKVFHKILNQDYELLLCTSESLLLKYPPKEFYLEKDFQIQPGDIIAPGELSEKLVSMGYQLAMSVEEPGTFARRGEVFDIFPISSEPVRMNYFDEMIEEMHYIDKKTNKTKRDKPVDKVNITAGHASLLSEKYTKIFKQNFPRPKHTQSELYNKRKAIFELLNNSIYFDELPYYTNYFFNETSTLLEYVYGASIFIFDQFNTAQQIENYKENLNLTFDQLDQNDENILKPSPDLLIDNNFDLQKVNGVRINPFALEVSDADEAITLELESFQLSGNKMERILQLARKLGRFSGYKLFVYYQDEKFVEEFKHLLETQLPGENFSSVVYLNLLLPNGFIYPGQKFIFISQADLYTIKTKKFNKKHESQHNDLYAEMFSSLEVGDYIVHKEFGVGRYIGIETLNLNNTENDFIAIEYKDQDKVYVPAYKIGLIQKFATASSNVVLANLKSKKFELAKQKAAKSIKKLAFNLLELHARRKLKESHSFSCPERELTDFELSFKFEETPDQKKAIEDVYADMQSKQPMDRLVCGDVGFGKTEVAMRAAYAAVLDAKQVCVLVPTTVLALQHYHSFSERFKDFAVNIDFISRFKSPKQSKQTLEKLEQGKIDIIIGTHKLLSDKIKFKDLGLMIIDEEQRFGVGHKEKLKLLKETVDTLVLTATPIPRTLQLSFIGLKDLSLIKTPPPKRQSIKTYLIKEDANTIKVAIEKELSRNGQVFIVHNKVGDIEIFTSKIRELAPKARIIYAHGQMSETELEKRITAFYEHEYDILISTTIIESGIDIPNANTMIIDRADTYGLAQLHQLRGRIGRSHKKAYAYLTIPKFQKLTDVAAKRLRAITQHSAIGSGFALATSDLEIRGSGDILGAEQSGHLHSIGIELYMELLEETINQIKGEDLSHFKDIEVLSPFACFIPSEFMDDSALRLKYYKKISNSRSTQLLDNYREEILDLFGSIPIELDNLLEVLKIRISLQECSIDKLHCRSHSVTIHFNEKELAQNNTVRDKVLDIFMKRPKIYKINPDFSINCKFKDKININDLSNFADHIAQQIKQ